MGFAIPARRPSVESELETQSTFVVGGESCLIVFLRLHNSIYIETFYHTYLVTLRSH